LNEQFLSSFRSSELSQSICSSPGIPAPSDEIIDFRTLYAEEIAGWAQAEMSSKSGQLEYAWLCSSCSLYLTIQIDEELGTRVVRKLETKNGSKFGTSANERTNIDIA
jgi:hypothetical protein